MKVLLSCRSQKNAQNWYKAQNHRTYRTIVVAFWKQRSTSIFQVGRSNRPFDRSTWKVRTLQCSQMLQRKLQKFKSSNTNTPEEETIHSNGPADRAYRPTEQAVRTDCQTEWTTRSIEPPVRSTRLFDPLTLVSILRVFIVMLSNYSG